MTILYTDLLHVRFNFISTSEASQILGISHLATSRLVRQGKIQGVKIGRSYMVPRASVQELAKTYVPCKGRPRMKRRYAPKWKTT